MMHTSGDDLRREIQSMEYRIEAYKKELSSRSGDGNTYTFGFPVPEGWTSYPTFSEAADEAIKYFQDEDAPYKVRRVYY